MVLSIIKNKDIENSDSFKMPKALKSLRIKVLNVLKGSGYSLWQLESSTVK